MFKDKAMEKNAWMYRPEEFFTDMYPDQARKYLVVNAATEDVALTTLKGIMIFFGQTSDQLTKKFDEGNDCITIGAYYVKRMAMVAPSEGVPFHKSSPILTLEEKYEALLKKQEQMLKLIEALGANFERVLNILEKTHGINDAKNTH